MIDHNSLVIIILLLFNFIFGILGYMLGKFTNTYHPTSSVKSKQVQANNREIIQINDTKVVTAIKTDNLEKKFDSLGDKKQSQENISSAINKLKNMKG